jgi:hypothetical protein
MEKHVFLPMVGPTYPLPGAMHPPVAVNPLLHGHMHAYWVGIQHPIGCCGVPPLVPQHPPWRSTCFSPWLAPPTHCQVSCTHIVARNPLLHGYMHAYWVGSQHPGSCWGAPPLVPQHPPWKSTCFSKCLAPPTPYQVAMNPPVAVNRLLHGHMHACWVDNHHPVGCWGAPPLVSQHPPWRSTCFSPWLAPSTHYQVPCTHMWLGIHSFMATCLPTGLTTIIMLVVGVSHP